MRKILLIEPNYKNKYPPMGLMKLSTYHKMIGDKVTFYKGKLSDFISEEYYFEMLKELDHIDQSVNWYEYKKELILFIKTGRHIVRDKIITVSDNSLVEDILVSYRKKYRNKDYLNNKKWDRVCITTLFTFYMKETIKCINDFKQLCKEPEQVFVGGISASVVPDSIYEGTGITPIKGTLNNPGVLDSDNNIIIDRLPLDYSILSEISYEYRENSGYYGYMTRGCVNKCKFCVVPSLEPQFNDYIPLTENVKTTNKMFGERRNLLLLDNNVLASNCFDEIIDEIKSIGFAKGDKFTRPNMLLVNKNGLMSGYNDKAYRKATIKLLNALLLKSGKYKDKEKLSNLLVENKFLNYETFISDKYIEMYEDIEEHYLKIYKHNRKVVRHVDFNQGIDARLMTPEKVKKLSEISIRPARIAFDNWAIRDKYVKAVKLCAKNDINNMSNYLLYNYTDKPEDLYNRLKINIDLCEELSVNIYSFPMKYHPITDPAYFSNRHYVGKHWNRKFVRAIQSILNATKGKIGKGKSFFLHAFGNNLDEFYKLLYMPEAFIIYRSKAEEVGLTQTWWKIFNNLSEDELKIVKPIIEANDFGVEHKLSNKLSKLLDLYKIKRKDMEDLILEDKLKITACL